MTIPSHKAFHFIVLGASFFELMKKEKKEAQEKLSDVELRKVSNK